ncbi:hypothetical protein [Leifsonia sp. NPDC058248]|uniref:hypothetical protein n=1 Tax=Leifsonia sp. NPDC058248 TaxID=3346402 RepID=UPI0036DBF582
MTRDETIAAIAARPEDDLREAIAQAAHAALLDDQNRGVPSSVRAGLLSEFAAVKRELLAALAEVEHARP